MQKNIWAKRMSRTTIAASVLAIISGMGAYAADSEPSKPADAPAVSPAASTAATTTPSPESVPSTAVPADKTAAPAGGAAAAPAPVQPTPSMVPTEASASSASNALKQKSTDTTVEKNLDQTFKASERQYSLSKKGSYSLIYDFGYSYYANQVVDIALNDSSSTINRFRIQNDAQHAITNTFTFQYGFLDNITLTAGLPFVAKVNPPNETDTAGLGDVSVGARWQPFPSGTTPLPITLFGSLTMPTGDSPYEIDTTNGLSTGSGYYSVGGGISTSKFIDPIVLFGTLSGNYGLNVSGLNQARGNRILKSFNPGYTTGIGFGFAYSLNYDVSLTISYQQSFSFDSEFKFTNGDISRSSVASAATLNSSLGIRVSPKTIVNVSLGFGLTPDSPNVLLGLSLPLDFLGLGRQVK